MLRRTVCKAQMRRIEDDTMILSMLKGGTGVSDIAGFQRSLLLKVEAIRSKLDAAKMTEGFQACWLNVRDHNQKKRQES